MAIHWMQEVKKRKEKIIEQTQQFLRIESILDEKTITTNQPFGEGINQALQYMLTKAKKEHFFTKNIDGYAGLIEYGEGEESVGILVHLDVVPAGNGWTSPPFDAEIRDGRIYARGAIDNKGPAMASLFALMIVKELDLPLKKRMQIIIGTDEESDWRCVEHYFKTEEMPTVGFVPDADFPIIYAEKGIADVTFHLKNKRDVSEESLRLLRSYAGERLNMVPDKAKAELIGTIDQLNRIEESFQMYLSEQGLEGSSTQKDEKLIVEIEGKSAHGSTPEKGINAGIELAIFLNRTHLDQEANDYLSFITTYLHRETDGNSLGIKSEDEMSGILTVNSGIFRYDSNESIVGLNIRYPVTKQGDEYFRQLEKLANEIGATFTINDHMKPSYVEKEHPLISTLQKVYERQIGEEATLLSTGGGTYARALKTGVAFGALFPGREDVAHQKDEYIEIEDLLKATALYAEAIYELAK